MYMIVEGPKGTRLTDDVDSIWLPSDLMDLELFVEMLVDHFNDQLPEGVFFSFDEFDTREDKTDWRDAEEYEDSGLDEADA